MKGSTTASIFVPTKDGLSMLQPAVVALLGALITVFAEQTSKNIRAPAGKTSVSFEEDVRYAGIPGFWVHVTSEVAGFTGPVSAYVEALVNTGIARYYELDAEYIAMGNPKAPILAQRALITPEPSGILSAK